MKTYSFSKESTAGILRGLRATARLSQKELAEKSGVSESAIKGYENAENVMSLEAAVKLANVFGITPDSLVNTVEIDERKGTAVAD